LSAGWGVTKRSSKSPKSGRSKKVDLSQLELPKIDLAAVTNPDIRNFLSHTGNTESLAKAYWMLGVEAEGRMEWENAIECYQAVLAINPADPLSRYFAPHNLAYALIQMKRYEEAVRYAETAVAVNDAFPFAYHTLGLALRALARYTEAAYAFLTAIVKGQKSNTSWLQLQSLVSEHPELYDQIPRLSDDIEHTRKALESSGLLKRTH